MLPKFSLKAKIVDKTSWKAGSRRGLTSCAQRSSAGRPPRLRSEPQRQSSSSTRGRWRSLKSERPEPSPNYSQLTWAPGDRARHERRTNSRAVLASGSHCQGQRPKHTAGDGGNVPFPGGSPASPHAQQRLSCCYCPSFPFGCTHSALGAQTAEAASRVFTPR